ncbi:MAG: glycosyltransferase [Candidatus Baldrarchaeia archaeon]
MRPTTVVDFGVMRRIWPTTMEDNLLFTIGTARPFIPHHKRRLLLYEFNPYRNRLKCIVDLTFLEPLIDTSGKPFFKEEVGLFIPAWNSEFYINGRTIFKIFHSCDLAEFRTVYIWILQGLMETTSLVMHRVMFFVSGLGADGKVLEAQACSLPVVGSRIPEIIDIIKDGENGKLVNVGDLKGFITAIKQYYLLWKESTERYYEMNRRIREQTIQQYDWDEIISDLEKLFIKLRN